MEKRSHYIAKLGRVASVASEAAWQVRENEDRAQRLRAGPVWHLARHPMAIFITIMGTHGHFRYTLVRAYVCIFLSSTELTDDEKLQITIRKHLKLLYN